MPFTLTITLASGASFSASGFKADVLEMYEQWKKDRHENSLSRLQSAEPAS